MNYTINECYSGGGCDHYEIVMEDYSLFFLINDNENNIPKEGESWGFCVYDNLESFIDGNLYIHCEGPFDNFKKEGLIDFIKGYVAAKGFKKDSQNFNLKDVDFMQLTLDIHEKCEPHVMIEVFYNHLITLSKEDLLLGLTTWIDGEQLDIFNYVQKEN
jgi:hypothetical protein